MKRSFTGLLITVAALGFACGLAAAPMGTIDEKTGNITVTADNYQCTFFKNHMFPVWFKRPDGTDYPRVLYFNDRLYETTGKKRMFFLYRDLWAEREIILNRDDAFMIKMSGVFTNHFGDTVAPEEIKATYRYELRRNSPGIRIKLTIIRRKPAENPTVFHFFGLNPVFLGRPAPSIFIDGKEQPMPQVEDYREIKPPSTDVALIDPAFRIGLKTPKPWSVIQINKKENTIGFLGFRVLNWKGNYLTSEGEFYFEPKKN